MSHILFTSLEQQSIHAKEASEDMEVGILKTCQSVGDLRREVSRTLVCESEWMVLATERDMLGMSLTHWFTTLLQYITSAHLLVVSHFQPLVPHVFFFVSPPSSSSSDVYVITPLFNP